MRKTAHRTSLKHRRIKPTVRLTALLAVLLTPYVHAAEWKVTPLFELKETYSDNVKLVGAANAQSDFITEISPGLSIVGNGSRLKLNLRYNLQQLLYANQHNENRINHRLNADAKAELIDSLLFVDTSAAINQQNISVFGAQSSDNANVTNNRSDVKTVSVSPYLRHRFGSIAASELRYTHNNVETDTAGFAASQSDQILLALTSGPSFKTLSWGVKYSDQSSTYRNNGKLDSTTTSVDLRYLLTPQFSLTASGGHEKNSYASTSGERPQGYFWTSGFAWTPSARTSLEANAGKRYYGNTYGLVAKHRSRHSVWNLSYNESITTTQSEFLVPGNVNTADFLNALYAYETDAQQRQILVDNAIAAFGLPASLPNSTNYLTNRVFLQKQLQASVALNSAKSTLLLSAFRSMREAQTSQASDSALFGTTNQALTDDTRQVGASALWNWRLSSRTNVNTRVSYTRVEAPSTNRVEHNKTLTLGMSRQFQPKLKGNIELRRQQHDTNQATGDYVEHALSASLLMSF